MQEQKRRFKAVINGKPYTIVGPGSAAHFEAVTAMLNERLDQIKTLAPTLSSEDAAILLAFNALSDAVKIQAQAQQDTQE
ncbi:cell division protein ZapA [Lacticaseibacillus parakribbianus]|uniref:cell division protein ZapA n=1 Tax=Lacticaseibacillus parakribbianus TaxID=2970927 RepID=UPI0021CB6600|nr:cell division protein ZapA [Lacticaseibacillus parakribbianus]